MGFYGRLSKILIMIIKGRNVGKGRRWDDDVGRMNHGRREGVKADV
jgi:hypothetical protein